MKNDLIVEDATKLALDQAELCTEMVQAEQ